MPSTTEEEADQGPLTAEISDALSKLVHDHTGRGPSSAWTTFGKDLIVCVLADGLTKGEQSLVHHGRRDVVLDTRKAFQDTMRAEAVRLIEEISGRHVRAFMSNNSVDPDLGVEIFVLHALHDEALDLDGSVPLVAAG